MKKRWLDIPTLSQKNSGSGKDDWCGRTSSSMVHNYYQMLSGNTEKFIINGSDKKELVYPNGDLAARKGDKYYLGEPLERVKQGWKRESLFPQNKRKLPLSSLDVAKVLQPIIDSININNPVVVYTGISRNQSVPNHIVVISGYRKEDNGDIWLLIDDPATMRDTGATDEKSDFLGIENLQIIDPGLYGTRGCQYWLKASRLFEKNQRSSNPDDLWCDHSSSPGFIVWHNTTPTPDSNYSHFEETTGFSLPQLVSGVEQITATQAELANYYTHTEKEFAGGYFPVGGNTTWHGGLHLLGNEGDTVHAVADGVIVCARMPAKDTKNDSLDYGSRNFVLIRHGKDDQVWYSLYYHLKSVEIDSEEAKKIIWLSRDRLEFSNTRNLRQLPREEDNIPIHTFVAGDTALILNKDKDPWYYVQRGEVNCSENRGYVKFSGERMSEIDGIAEQLNTDDVIELNIPVKNGDVVGILGEGVTLEDGKKVSKPILHWSIFSPEIMPGFIESVDDDCNDDFLCDNKKIIELVENSLDDGCGLFKADGKLTSKEIEDFFKDEERAKKLRAIACKFKSEWSIKWGEQTKVLSQAGFAAKADIFNLYNFWDQVSEIDDKLPTNGHVWHYNPITFLQRRLFNAARANISSDMFEADKAFVLPNEALSLLSGIGKYKSGNVIKSAILIGHEGVAADTLDPAELSQKRADAVAAILTLDKDKFNQFLKSNEWGNRERRIMLSWFKTSEGVPYFEGSIEEEDEPALEAAVRAFQSSYKDDLAVDGIAGKDTFTKMYELILDMAAIKKFDKVDARGAGKTHAEAKGKPSACVVEAHFWTSEAATTIEQYDQNPSDTYKLWLGSIVEEIQPVVPTQSENQISFIPMVYTTTDLDRKKAVPLQTGSFLYIFHNNKLIRELQVQEEAKGERTVFKEVDLNALRQKHNGMLPEREDRQAIGDSGNDVVRIPYNGKANEGVFEVAVSAVQWGARYIEALEQGNEVRVARTQQLDLTGFSSGFDGSKNLIDIDDADTPQEIEVNGTKISTGLLSNHKGTGTALAYLQDSVWQASLLADQLNRAVEELKQVVEKAKAHPHYNSAVIAYPLFFNEEVRSESKRNDIIGNAAGYIGKLNPIMDLLGLDTAVSRGSTLLLNSFDPHINAMKATDEEKLKTVLKVVERKELRENIRNLKKAHVDWLEGKNDSSTEDFIPFSTAIIDYFSLPTGCYQQAFEVMTYILNHLANDPADIDAPLTLAEDRQAQVGKDNPGYRYMQELFDEEHPLHKMLFPTEEQIPVESDAAPSQEIVQIDGSGIFRPHALDPEGFAAAAGINIKDIEAAEFPGAVSSANDEGQTYRRIAEFSAGTMTFFAGNFTKHWADWHKQHLEAVDSSNSARAAVASAGAEVHNAKQSAASASKQTKRMEMLARSLKASSIKTYGTLQVGGISNLPADHVVIGLNVFGETGTLSNKGMVNYAREYNRRVKEGTAGDVEVRDSQGGTIAAEDYKKVGAKGSAGRSGSTVWSITQDANRLDVGVISMHREVAAAVGIDYFDVHHHVEADLRSGAGNGAVRPSVQAIHDAQNELRNAEAELKQQADVLTDIDARKGVAETSQIRGKQLGQVAAGATVVAALFNVWNTHGAFLALEKGNSLKTIELGSAVMDMMYALGEAAEALFKNSKTVRAATQFRVGGIIMFRGLGFVAAGASAVLCVVAAIQEYRSGDSDAMVAQGIMAIGFGLSAIQLGAAAIVTEASGALLTSLAAGPIGWIGLGLVLVGAALYMVLNDTELERWAKNGPFALSGTETDDKLEWLKDGAMTDDSGNVDGFPAFEFLIGTLFTPSLTVDLPTEGRPEGYSRHTGITKAIPAHSDIIVRVALPPLFPYARVEILAEHEHHEERFSNPADHSQGHYELPVKSDKLNPLDITKERQLTFTENGHITRNYQYATLPNPLPVPEHGRRVIEDKGLINVHDIYRFKARLHAGEALVLPVIPRDASGKREEAPAAPEGLKKVETGWIYGLADFTASRFTDSRWLKSDNILPERG